MSLGPAWALLGIAHCLTQLFSSRAAADHNESNNMLRRVYPSKQHDKK